MFPSIAYGPRLCWHVAGKHASAVECMHGLSTSAALLHLRERGALIICCFGLGVCMCVRYHRVCVYAAGPTHCWHNHPLWSCCFHPVRPWLLSTMCPHCLCCYLCAVRAANCGRLAAACSASLWLFGALFAPGDVYTCFVYGLFDCCCGSIQGAIG